MQNTIKKPLLASQFAFSVRASSAAEFTRTRQPAVALSIYCRTKLDVHRQSISTYANLPEEELADDLL